MSKTFPFENRLDQTSRSAIRQPLKVNRRAQQAIRELQLEEHQDFEIQEMDQATQMANENFKGDVI